MYRNIGILGGSFNPPHLGHIHISKLAIKKLKLHKLLWVVSPQNPLKEKPQNSFQERLNLCKLITKNHPKITVTDLEYEFFKYNKKFYTYNFLKRLKQKFGGNLTLIIGADNLINFHKWYNCKKISEIAEIIVFSRASKTENYKYKAVNSKFGLSKKYRFIDVPFIKISSTEIRENV